MPATSFGDDDDARHTALYDPDTVFPVTGVGGDNVPDVMKPAEKPVAPQTGTENATLYARRERTRAAAALSEDAVKRIVDRLEQKARKP